MWVAALLFDQFFNPWHATDLFLYSLKRSENQSQKRTLKKGFLRNFAKFVGKQLYQRLFFNKVAGLRPESEAYNFINKETLAQVFSCEFCEISKNTYFTEHLWMAASAKLSSCFQGVRGH